MPRQTVQPVLESNSTAMQHVRPTLRKIFTGILCLQAEEDAPLLAWPLACGSAVAQKTMAIRYGDEELTVEVHDAAWKNELQALTPRYLAALRQITVQPVTSIKFIVAGQSDLHPRSSRRHN